MDFPWRSFADPDPEADLRGVVGQLHPPRYRLVPRIMLDSRTIESQLAGSDGLVGYALRAEPLRRRFWAVAAWESDDALQAFVDRDPHAGIRAALKERLAESWFDRFELTGAEVPLDVDEAVDRVGRAGR